MDPTLRFKRWPNVGSSSAQITITADATNEDQRLIDEILAMIIGSLLYAATNIQRKFVRI